MDEIKLPPLPRPDAEFGTHSRKQIRAYAIAAIEADRQARGEPVAWHSKQYGVVWMAIKPGNLVAGTQWFIQGRQEPVAEVVSPVSLVWHVATSELGHGTVFYTAPQPQQIPEGYKLVPIEPTDKMLRAAYHAVESEAVTTTVWLRKTVYKAMVEAAPDPTPEQAKCTKSQD